MKIAKVSGWLVFVLLALITANLSAQLIKAKQIRKGTAGYVLTSPPDPDSVAVWGASTAGTPWDSAGVAAIAHRAYLTDSLGFATSPYFRLIMLASGFAVPCSSGVQLGDTVAMRIWARANLASQTDTTKKAARSKTTDTLRTAGATGEVHTKGDTVMVTGKVSMNGTQIIYRPDQTSFLGSMIFSDGGISLTHNTGLTGQFNTFCGINSGKEIQTGHENSFFGGYSGLHTTTGASNSFFGGGAGQENRTGSNNSFFGSDCGMTSTGAIQNSFFGNLSGANDTGSYNSFYGYSSGTSNLGHENTFIGEYSGVLNLIGSGNTFLGVNSGRYNTTGNGRVAIGYDAGLWGTTTDSTLYIDILDRGSEATQITNSLIYGIFSNNPTKQILKVNAALSAPTATFATRCSTGKTFVGDTGKADIYRGKTSTSLLSFSGGKISTHVGDSLLVGTSNGASFIDFRNTNPTITLRTPTNWEGDPSSGNNALLGNLTFGQGGTNWPILAQIEARIDSTNGSYARNSYLRLFTRSTSGLKEVMRLTTAGKCSISTGQLYVPRAKIDSLSMIATSGSNKYTYIGFGDGVGERWQLGQDLASGNILDFGIQRGFVGYSNALTIKDGQYNLGCPLTISPSRDSGALGIRSKFLAKSGTDSSIVAPTYMYTPLDSTANARLVHLRSYSSGTSGKRDTLGYVFCDTIDAHVTVSHSPWNLWAIPDKEDTATLAIMGHRKTGEVWAKLTKNGWEYPLAKRPTVSSSLEDKVNYLLAKVDSLEKREARTRRSLAKALIRIKALEGK